MIEGTFKAKYIGSTPYNRIESPEFISGEVYDVYIGKCDGFLDQLPYGLSVTCINNRALYKFYGDFEIFLKDWIILEDKNMEDLMKEISLFIYKKVRAKFMVDDPQFEKYHEYNIEISLCNSNGIPDRISVAVCDSNDGLSEMPSIVSFCKRWKIIDECIKVFKAKYIGSSSVFIYNENYDISVIKYVHPKKSILGIFVFCPFDYDKNMFYTDITSFYRDWDKINKEDNNYMDERLIGKKLKAKYHGITKNFESGEFRTDGVYNIRITRPNDYSPHNNSLDLTPLFVTNLDDTSMILSYNNAEVLMKVWELQSLIETNNNTVKGVKEMENLQDNNIISRPMVITLCGSSKFKTKFDEVQRNLSLQGYIVLSLDYFIKTEDDNRDELLKIQKDLADRNLFNPIIDSYINNISNVIYPKMEDMVRVHYSKIDISDAIFVINVDNYIGNNTLNEIEYAYSKGKKVFYLSRYSNIKIPEEAWE